MKGQLRRRGRASSSVWMLLSVALCSQQAVDEPGLLILQRCWARSGQLERALCTPNYRWQPGLLRQFLGGYSQRDGMAVQVPNSQAGLLKYRASYRSLYMYVVTPAPSEAAPNPSAAVCTFVRAYPASAPTHSACHSPPCDTAIPSSCLLDARVSWPKPGLAAVNLRRSSATARHGWQAAHIGSVTHPVGRLTPAWLGTSYAGTKERRIQRVLLFQHCRRQHTYSLTGNRVPSPCFPSATANVPCCRP